MDIDVASCYEPESVENIVDDQNNTGKCDVEMCSSKDDTENIIRSDMISRVAKSDAHFKHQQRGEPDLTFEEKRKIAEDILLKNPSMFLARFGQFLLPKDVDCFNEFKGNYEVDFYLKEILKHQDKVHSLKVVKNRRFAAMKELMDLGEYFSEDEMKWRDPLLYEEMIGKHLSEEEIQSKVDKTDLRFSNILLKHMDQIQENYLYALQKEAEECQEEEEEEEEEIEEEDMHEELGEGEDGKEKKPTISSFEKQMLKAEFLQIMQERFMSGKDQDFDYSTVDNNTLYDSLETLEKDEEEKYFDEEEPHRVDSPFLAGQMEEEVDSSNIINTPAVPVHERVAGDESDIQDYMNFDLEGDGDLTKATSELTKMAVSGSSGRSLEDNG